MLKHAVDILHDRKYSNHMYLEVKIREMYLLFQDWLTTFVSN